MHLKKIKVDFFDIWIDLMKTIIIINLYEQLR